jgi:16S rRNA (cytosine1402-N4)-methyltransferase
MTIDRSPHIPVMCKELTEHLVIDKNSQLVYVDCTFGAGGHSAALLRDTQCHIIAIDRDATNQKFAQSLAEQYPGRLKFFNSRFSDIDQILKQLSLEYVDGIFYDLGISSMQIDTAERGFSFQQEARLDMRMGLCDQTAYELVNNLSDKQLADIIYQYGDERKARRIAFHIVKARQKNPIETTTELANIIKQAVKSYRDNIDPATRTFQALRIVINDELGELETSLCKAIELLRPGTGRLVTISFHSLEDGIIKHQLRKAAGQNLAPFNRHDADLQYSNETATPRLLSIITKKPITPCAEEIRHNVRSRSAKMRVAERLPLDA